ncbi:methyl-accepting chemotaxis protein [Leadbettera azotonutricia]|uniref:Methyl-accepting chemotaxis protein n=1 Tax=Leadbettera azotonutricia (strain ATCC BAA-888 / DSM 13862 / ZAS-9) TaxID=545695 RepID=F5YBX2_LEAAZ|nr:HAMP domain-containing methyl-accepting chemotaxis protein [Leadbettera azotonutricia]AEF82548.1 methyl-accepting chemotaxis protein [Leadbettera azotonutricia ZAS-9]
MNKINIFQKITIKSRLLIFSIVLFLLIAGGIIGAFFLAMGQIVRSNADQELTRLLETKRLSLEASIESELVIALKMADSPLIARFFLDPYNPELETIAMEEFAGYRRAFGSGSIFWINDQDKKYYLGDTAEYVLDPTEPESAWYSPTLNMHDEYEFFVDYERSLQKTVLWVNVPVRVQGKPIGIVGTGIEIGDFIDTIYADLAPEVSLYLFNNSLEITGARDSRLIVDKVQLGTHLKSEGPLILDAIGKLRGTEISTLNLGQETIALGRIPLLNWHAVAFMPITRAMYFESSMTLVFAAMLVVVLLIFVIVNFFIVSSLKPLKHTMEVLKQISADWDLTRQLAINSGDEFGELAEFFNITFGKIRELLTVIRNKAGSLSDTGADLASNMIETAAAINEITANIQSMEDRAVSQSSGVTKTTSAMERIMVSIGQLNEHILAQSDSVSQSSSAIEEMLANIRSVAETLVKNSENVNSLAESANVGRNDLQKVSEDIQEIARESEGLLEINSVIDNIASQTNLLSMNAAIEAAHAGESGKGFAVVADEIRKLAESSSEQSKTISTVLKKIKSSIDSITQSTNVVIKRFEVIEKEVRIVSDQEAGIRGAMEEQETGSRQILEAVSKLNELTAKVKQGSEEMTAEGQGVMRQSKDLEGIAAEMANGMEEMAKGAEQINIAVVQVNEISGENKTNIDALNTEVSKFKVG